MRVCVISSVEQKLFDTTEVSGLMNLIVLQTLFFCVMQKKKQTTYWNHVRESEL